MKLRSTQLAVQSLCNQRRCMHKMTLNESANSHIRIHANSHSHTKTTAIASHTHAELSSAEATPIQFKSSQSWFSSLRRLWIRGSDEEFEAAERQVLKRIQTPFQQQQVHIGKHNYINTIVFDHHTIKQTMEQQATVGNHFTSSPSSVSHPIPLLFGSVYPVYSSSPLVLLHGFAAGIGLWLQNCDHLSAYFDRVYGIDMLGHGRSSRARFTAKTVEEAEAFFVDSLEAWRQKQQLQRITLLGHSLGGYIAACYTIKYPQNVERLILLSPLGVPQRPQFVEPRHSRRPFTTRLVFNFLEFIWQYGFTPQQAVKLAGPKGKQFIQKYVENRFRMEELHLEAEFARRSTQAAQSSPSTDNNDSNANSMSSEQLDERSEAIYSEGDLLLHGLDHAAVTEYLYQSFVQPGSGEYALSVLLHPGAFAKQPLSQRLPQWIVKHKIPISTIYGTQDWMSPEAGKAMVQQINQQVPNLASCIFVRDSGHQLQIENRRGFTEAVMWSTIFDRLNDKQRQEFTNNFQQIQEFH